MVSRPRGDGRGRYVCSRDPGRNGCGGTFILADEVDAFIADAVINRLDTPRLAASIRRRAAVTVRAKEAARSDVLPG